MEIITNDKEIELQDKDHPADTSGETYSSAPQNSNQTAATPSNNG